MDTLQLIALVITIAVNFYFAFIVFIKDRKSETNVYFSLLLIGVGLWAFSNYMYNRGDLSYSETVFWMRMIFVVTTPFIFLILNFAFSFPNRQSNLKYQWKLLLIIPMILITILALGDSIITGANKEGTITPIFGSGMFIYFSYAIVYITLSLIVLVKKYLSTKGIIRSQIQYLFLGFALFTVPALFTNLILVALFNNVSLVPFGPVFSLFLAFFLSYSILKHKLFDLYYLSGVFLIYALISIIIYIIYYAVISLDFLLFGSVYSIGSLLLNTIIAVIFSSFIFTLKDKIESTVKLNIKSISNLEYTYAKLKVIVNENANFEDLSNKVIETISEGFHLNFTDIVISQKYTDGTGIVSVSNNEKKINYESLTRSSLIAELEQIKTVYLKQEWKVDYRVNFTNFIDSIFQQTDINVIVPIQTGNKTIAVIFGSEKISGQAFTIQDVEYFWKTSQILSIPLERSLLLREASEFNRTLSDKVDQATAEIRDQKNKLENQYQEEKDMMGIIGHELRTPLTIAKGNLEYMLKKLDGADPTEKEMLQQKIRDSFDSVKRESDLVQTMLSTSHVDRNKIDLHPEPTDITILAKQSVSDFLSDANKKELQLIYAEPTTQIPLVYADPLRMTEVTNNLVSNAVKYTEKGMVTVFITADEKFAYINVKDTGRGISEEDLKNVGKKFFRVDNYLSDNKTLVRPGGTGLGLYVVKGLLQASGGELLIQSRVGEGSTFTAKIPLYKGSSDQPISSISTGNRTQNVDLFIQMGLKNEDTQNTEVQNEIQNQENH